jgi:hypothetical protein
MPPTDPADTAASDASDPATDESPETDAEEPAAALATFVERVLDMSVDDLDATATVTGQDPTPGRQLLSLVADADSATGVLPTLPMSLLDGADGLDGLRAALVVTGAARERLDGPALSLVESRLAGADVTLYGHDGDAPVGLLLLDDIAVLCAFDATGEPGALLVSRAPELRAWIAESCSRYRDEADVLVG